MDLSYVLALFREHIWETRMEEEYTVKVRDKRNMPTPEWHENGKEDSGWVVKEVAGTGSATGCAQMPILADTITERAHGEILFLVAHLLTEIKKNK